MSDADAHGAGAEQQLVAVVDVEDVEIGAAREIRIVRRILRDYIRTLHKRQDLVGEATVTVMLTRDPRFAPRAVLCHDGEQRVELTHGTCWWAHLCARAIVRAQAGLTWPDDVPRSITRPLDVPQDPQLVRLYSQALARDIPDEQDAFFVFLFVTILLGVLFHEISHILRGHLLFLAAQGDAGKGKADAGTGARAGELGGVRLAMVDDGTDRPIASPRLDRRDLEHDADSVAGFLYGELLLGADDLYPMWEPNPPAENLSWGLVGYALFCCGIAEAAPASSAYADPLSRFMSFFYGARQYAAVRLTEDPMAEQAMIDCFTVLAAAEDALPYVADFRDLADEGGLRRRTDELMAIMDHMPALNRLLAPFWTIPSTKEWGQVVGDGG